MPLTPSMMQILPNSLESNIVGPRNRMLMRQTAPQLDNSLIRLEPANVHNVALLIKWTLDPIAQGPYKRVPALDSDDLRRLFLDSQDRQYFLIRRTTDACPLGRFYWRVWQFAECSAGIDWE